jgi:Uma2 family endonuclease
MTANTGLMTADDLWHLPEDHLRHDLVRGQLRTMPLRTMLFGHVASQFNAALRLHGDVDRYGEVVIGVGCHIASDPDTVRAPTIALFRHERLTRARDLEGYVPGVPDLVVEIVDIADTFMDVDDCVSDWLEHGTRLVFVVNPRRQTVCVHQPGQPARVLGIEDELGGEDVVPGWSMPVREVFDQD